MPSIFKIFKAIDEELERTGKSYLEPPEANLVLDRKGILKDRAERPGSPLRTLLRQGEIPHAFQVGGKWRIPHSMSKNSQPSDCSAMNEKKPRVNKAIDQEIDFTETKKGVEEAREHYKPDKIKYLLIAEAPPDSVERFFYYTDVKIFDWLFLGVMEALYPSEKKEYLQQRGKSELRGRSELKEKLLLKFKADGFYLEDLSNTIDDLVKKIKRLSTEETKIILIKVNVYDKAFSLLKGHNFNVIDKRIDFPASGGQIKFQVKFKEALIEANYFKNSIDNS